MEGKILFGVSTTRRFSYYEGQFKKEGYEKVYLTNEITRDPIDSSTHNQNQPQTHESLVE